MNKQISYKIVSLVFGILVICFVVGFYVLAWTDPLQSPPGCTSGQPGCDAPLNVGPTGQIKTGPLGVNGVFRAYSNTIIDGNVGIGTTTPGTNKLEVVGGPVKATGGLIIETRTSDPAGPVTGQMWLRTDL